MDKYLISWQEAVKWAVAVGEMFDAISFYGPFDTFEDAEYWAGNNASLNWWIVGLENPNA